MIAFGRAVPFHLTSKKNSVLLLYIHTITITVGVLSCHMGLGESKFNNIPVHFTTSNAR